MSKYLQVLRKELDKIEYDNKLISNIGEDVPRISSGCLVNDLVLGGGIPPAMVTYSGHEGGAKTTLLNHTLNSAIHNGISTIIHFDAENSRDPDYVMNIYKEYSFDQVYGVPANKGWETPPLINYYPYSQFERVFKVLRYLLNILPDKIYRKQDDTWYYVFSSKKEDIARMKSMSLTPDKKLSDRKHYWCPTNEKGIQAIFSVDSWVALVLEAEDEMSKDNTGLTPEAREFSKQLRRVKGKLTRKQLSLIGANQVRVNPMAMYGSPEYEPGGAALKFYCFSSDTWLFTEKGMMQADNLLPITNKEQVNVLGTSGLEKISNYQSMGYKPLLQVTTDLGFGLVGSRDHLVWAKKPNANKPMWIKLGDCKNRYKLAIKSNAQIWPEKPFKLEKFTCDTFNFPTRMNSKLAKLLGYLSAYSNIYKDRFDFYCNKEVIRDNFITLFSDCFQIPKEECIKFYKDEITFTLRNKNLTSYLQYLNPSISPAIMQSPKKYVIKFIRTYCEAIGFTIGNKGYSLDWVIDHKAKALQLLLLNLGIITKTSGTITTNSSTVISSQHVNMYFNIENFKKYKSIIGFSSKGNYWMRKPLTTEIIKESDYNLEDIDGSKYKINESKHDNFIWTPIKDIRVPVSDMMLYDGHMKKTNTIITNGIVSHNSDIRNVLRPVVPPKEFTRDKEAMGLSVESGVLGGKDRYAFKQLKNVKNKYGRPMYQGKLRVWVSDKRGKAQGIDPVFDTWEYLKMTGQLTGSIKRNFDIKHPKLKSMDWETFKILILSEHFSYKKYKKLAEEKGIKQIKLRQWCKDQIANGKGTELFSKEFQNIKQDEEEN